MSEPNKLCILAVSTRADDHFINRVGHTEAKHAAERCMNRAERVIAGHSGHILNQEERSLVVGFDHCDSAVQAATEILERIRSLPTISGLLQPIRIAVHCREEGGNDDQAATIDLACRLAQAAKTEQALTSAAAVGALSASARQLVARDALGGTQAADFPFPLFVIGERNARAAIVSLPPLATLSHRLHVIHQGKSIFIDEMRPVLLLGRELGNDIVISDARASRQHARIERRRQGFFLIDASTNGCYVVIDEDEIRKEQHLRQEALLLTGTGRFGCGFAADGSCDDEVSFELL